MRLLIRNLMLEAKHWCGPAKAEATYLTCSIFHNRFNISSDAYTLKTEKRVAGRTEACIVKTE